MMRAEIVALGLILIVCIVGATGCSRAAPVSEIRPVSTRAPAAGGVTDAASEDGNSTAPQTIEPAETDWPCWRGADQTGIALSDAPTEWSATKNVVWSVDVPGKGHSSPTVWGERVFLATADEGAKTMLLLAFSREKGDLLWTCPLHQGGFMHVHGKNTQASATAACDGKHVYWVAMVKDAIWLSAVTLEGKIAWQTEVGPFVSMHGYGSSPVLYKGLVIVQGDSNGPGWLSAINAQTGETHWRVQRGSGASFGTPVIAHVAGKPPQLLLSGQDKVISYDPLTGDKLWECSGPSTVAANTMCARGDLVFASGGYPQRNVFAIKADGSGQIVWRKPWKCYVPSMLVDGDRLVIPQDDGVLHVVEATTGKELWTKRVGGDLTSSPVLAGGKLYVTIEAGKTVIFGSTSKSTEVATNDNGERCYATPTICGGQIFLRTHSKLLCIGEPVAAGGK